MEVPTNSCFGTETAAATVCVTGDATEDAAGDALFGESTTGLGDSEEPPPAAKFAAAFCTADIPLRSGDAGRLSGT